MTRINVVPVLELMDQHIMAEYFELPRIFVLVHKHTLKGRTPEDLKIPDTYRLGTGHMAFFYDKLLYLTKRHVALRDEGRRRNIPLEVDPNAAGIEHISFRHTAFWGDYEPTPEALVENRKRIAEKIAMYPSWYKYDGIPFNDFK